MARTATTTDAFNAVAEASRRDLLDAIGTGEATVGALVHRLGLSQPQVSKHLGVLRAVGLVLVRVDGRHHWYRVNAPALKPIHDWVRTFERAWNTRLDRLDDLLAELQTEERAPMNSKPTANRHGSAVITLPSDTEYLITRAFDASAESVFVAFTTPQLVKRWWGFETSEWLVCEIDLREGGQWRFVTRDDGEEVGFHGEYREIARPHRLVSTEAYEGLPDPDASAALNTMTLDEVDGVTTMELLVQHVNQTDRDAVLESGMESGMQVSYDRLEDLVRKT